MSQSTKFLACKMEEIPPCGVVMKIECINVCRVLTPAKNLICVNVLLDFTVLLTHCLRTNEAALLFHVQASP